MPQSLRQPMLFFPFFPPLLLSVSPAFPSVSLSHSLLSLPEVSLITDMCRGAGVRVCVFVTFLWHLGSSR